MEEALHGMSLLREFAGLEGWGKRLPDEGTTPCFRYVLDKHKLITQMLQIVNDLLTAKGLLFSSGTVVGCHTDRCAQLHRERHWRARPGHETRSAMVLPGKC